jgi:hypothetical protein
MSGPGYPPDRYTGAGGRVNASLRRADTPPELTTGPGGAAHYLATGATTGGLYRWEMGPRRPVRSRTSTGASPSPSTCSTGTVRLYDGERWLDGSPGDFLHVPEGGIHGFRNELGEPASMLLLFTPGTPREDYFVTIADAARRESMDEAGRTEYFLRRDTFWV